MGNRILEYASGAVAVEELDIRREGEWLVVKIPPPELWRQIVHQLLRSMSQVGMCAVVGACLLKMDKKGFASLLSLAVVALVIACYLMIMLFIRLTQIGRSGRAPSIVVASKDGLTVKLPPSRQMGSRPHIQHISDLTIDEGRSFRALIRLIRLRIFSDDDTFEEILIPARENVATAMIEDNLRDALGLGPANQKSN